VPRAILALFLLPALAAPPAAQGAGPARWETPLPGIRVVRGFSFDRRAPYAPGQSRVARLEARPGRVVASPCAGRVLFAGGLPSGDGVSVRCGRLVATLTGLASVAIARGRGVSAGQPLGRTGAAGRFGLGARVAGRRDGYLDPLSLIGPGRRRPLLAPAPLPRRTVAPRRRRLPAGGRHEAGAAVLLGAAWLGLGLAGSAIGIGIALRGPRRTGAPAVRARPAGR